MVRTQVYLTEEERSSLAKLARTRRARQSVLIREAIDSYIERNDAAHRLAVLKRLAGMWKDRDDLPDFAQLRRESDRNFFK